jgi:hypothetical protein
MSDAKKRFKIANRGPIFFLHIPKTAGTSLRTYLRNQYQPVDVMPAENWPELIQKNVHPADYLLIQGHLFYNLRQTLKPKTPVVAVLREPLTRTLSGLRHLQRDSNFHILHSRAVGKSIQQLLRDPVIMRQQANIQAAALCASVPPDEVRQYLLRTLPDRSQAEASDLENPPTLELALQRLVEIDFLGTFDDLSSLMSTMAEAMDYHPASHLSLSNEAPSATTTLDGLTSEDLEILREHNRIDLELYQSAKDLVTLRSRLHALLRLAARNMYSCPTEAFEIDLAGPVPGHGWHTADQEGDAVWRWTGPEPQFTLEICLQRGVSYDAEMRVNAPEADRIKMLTLRLNGLSIPLTFEQYENSSSVRWHVPSTSTEPYNGCCILAFDVGSVFRVAGDMRRLGICVSSISLTPTIR